MDEEEVGRQELILIISVIVLIVGVVCWAIAGGVIGGSIYALFTICSSMVIPVLLFCIILALDLILKKMDKIIGKTPLKTKHVVCPKCGTVEDVPNTQRPLDIPCKGCGVIMHLR